MNSSKIFTSDYEDIFRLRNGEQVKLRLVKPSDKSRLVKGFSQLSDHSRIKRFMGSKTALSEAELAYFTELDETTHLALGVVQLNDDGQETDGIGIARFIQLPDKPDTAEVAVTVVDHAQGNGVGRHLLERLVEAAQERDIKFFRFECLPHNHEMQNLVKQVCQVVELRNSDGVMMLDVELPTVSQHKTRRASSIYDLLEGFATGALELQMDVGFKTMQNTLEATVIDPIWLKHWKSMTQHQPQTLGYPWQINPSKATRPSRSLPTATG